MQQRERISFFDAIAANKRRTWLLMGMFVALLTALGYAFDRFTAQTGDVFLGFVVFALVWTLISYYASASVTLAISGARPVTREEYPFLVNTLEGLAIAANIPVPRLYMIDTPAPNAFATGRDPQHAAVAVTRGLVERLNRQEIEGVLAHEVSHIANYDIRIQTIAVMLAGFIVLLADLLFRLSFWGGRGRRRDEGGALLILALISYIAAFFANLLKLAISREREYLADATAAMLTRNPEGLASALEKIALDPTPMPQASEATAHLYIVNPFKKGALARTMATLFSTHPPTEERIARLRSM
jgi:heat shock protein HtpX